MNQSPQTDKRIVSRGAYISSILTKVVIGTFGLSCILGSVLFFYALVTWLTSRHGKVDNDVALIGLAFCATIAVTAYIGGRLFYKAESIKPGIPLTRANTADLPAPESLVRASIEPVQESQAVLLRAATHRQETLVEQLVRPASRGE